jgi:inorganic pyrophosphatase
MIDDGEADWKVITIDEQDRCVVSTRSSKHLQQFTDGRLISTTSLTWKYCSLVSQTPFESGSEPTKVRVQ